MATITLTTDVNNHITAASGTSISYLQPENLIRDTSGEPTDFSGNINVADMILTTPRWSNRGTNNITITGGVSVFSAGAAGLGGTSNSIGSGATNIDGHDFINAGTGDASFGAFATGTGTIQNTNFINTSGTGWFLGFATWLGTFSNISLDGFLDSHASLATVVDGFTYSGRARGVSRTQAANDRNQGYTARVLMNGLAQDHFTLHNNVFPNPNNAYADQRASQLTCTINDQNNRIYLVNNRYEDDASIAANEFKVAAFGQGSAGTCEWIETYTWRPVFLDAADIAIGTTTVIEDVRIIGLPSLTRIFRDTQSATEYALSDAIATNVNPHSGGGRLTYLMQVGDVQQVTASNGQRSITQTMTKGLAFNLDGTTSVISPTSVTTKSYTHLIDEPTRTSEVNIPTYSGGATGNYDFTADEDISNYATDANLNGRTQTQSLALTALADITDAYPALKAHWYTTDTSRFAFTPTITGGLLNPGTGKSINFSRTGATDYASTGLRIQATTIGIGNVTGVTGATTTDYDTLTPPSGFTMGVGAHTNFGSTLDGVIVVNGSIITLATGSTSIANFDFGADLTTNAQRASVFTDNTGSTIKTISIPAGDTWLSEHSGLQALIEARNYTITQAPANVSLQIEGILSNLASVRTLGGYFVWKQGTSGSLNTVVIGASTTAAQLTVTRADNITDTFHAWYIPASPSASASSLHDYNYIPWTPSTSGNAILAPFEPDPTGIVIAGISTDTFALTPAASLDANSRGRYTINETATSFSIPDTLALGRAILNTRLYIESVATSTLDGDNRPFRFVATTGGSGIQFARLGAGSSVIELFSSTNQKTLSNAANIRTIDLASAIGVPSVTTSSTIVSVAPISDVDNALNANARLQYIAQGDINVLPRAETEAEYITRTS